jgi:hypothetical protein
MVRTLGSRVRRLERQRGISTILPCSGCGSHPTAVPSFMVSFAQEGERPQREYCPSCGRQVVFAPEFDERG